MRYLPLQSVDQLVSPASDTSVVIFSFVVSIIIE